MGSHRRGLAERTPSQEGPGLGGLGPDRAVTFRAEDLAWRRVSVSGLGFEDPVLTRWPGRREAAHVDPVSVCLNALWVKRTLQVPITFKT